jgi:hypothetical protein
MDCLEYENFDILIQHWDGEHYPTRVLRSLNGEAQGHFDISALAPEVIANLKSVRKFVLDSVSTSESERERWTRAKWLGELLFDALMSGNVRSCFDVSWNLAKTSGKGLRIRLRIEPPDLLGLPWELMCDKRSDRFLSLSIYTPIVHYIELQQTVPAFITYPLRILVVLSSPVDQVPLHIEVESTRIARALEHLQRSRMVQITVLRQATLQAVQKMLREEEYHILHYMGHAHFRAEDGEGFLIFEDSERSSHLISGRKLKVLLQDQPLLRLVVLNACSTSAAGETDPFSGVATSLVEAGIPAVVAMQVSIGDSAALQFAQVFYEALAGGRPIDAAVAEGRQAIDFISSEHSLEWAIPRLLMRMGDGILFTFNAQQIHGSTAAHPVCIPRLKQTSIAREIQDDGSQLSCPEAIAPSTTAVGDPSVQSGNLVTNEEFLRFINATGAQPPSTWVRGRFPREQADRPVTGVSWHAADAYTQWAGKRLPTAVEWEEALTCGAPGATQGVWEWTADVAMARGLGQQKTKRVAMCADCNGPATTARRSRQRTIWPEEQPKDVGFRCID